MKNAVLLINLGTPESPDEDSVGSFLKEFLNDPLVINLPTWIRRFMVNRIIVPSRVKHSASLYERLWTDKGSPILHNLNLLQMKLQKELGDETDVYIAMRYGQPALQDVIKQIGMYYYDEVIILPLFPQFAESTTVSALDFAKKNMQLMSKSKSLMTIHSFYAQPGYISAFVERINAHHPKKFDHLIFSFHSLPISHIQRLHRQVSYADCSCTKEFPDHGDKCYKAQCYETARLLASELKLKPEDYTVTFQSRFNKHWIGPFTDEVILNLARSGKSKVLVASPSFVADCLETIVEIGQDYKAQFIANGGKDLVLVKSLNDSNTWVKALAQMIRE